MSKNRLEDEFSTIPKELGKIYMDMFKLKSEYYRKADMWLAETLKNFTVSDIRQLWNGGSVKVRINILAIVPDISEKIDKLASYDGLSAGEIEDEIVNSEWNGTPWLDDMDYIFSQYCRA